MRGLIAVAVTVLAITPAAAQVQGHPVEPSVEHAPQPATNPPRAGRLLAPVAADAPRTSFRQPPPDLGGVVPEVGPPPGFHPPPPVTPGLPPAPQRGQDPFRAETRDGGVYTGLPRTLLWEPPMAMPREPRFLVMPTSLSNATTTDTVDTSIGTTIGLLRGEPAGWKTAVQADFFAVVTSRFSNYDFLVDTDYRFGFPVTFARGPWQWKVGYEHLSSHLGDEIQQRTGQQPIDYVKDEVVLGVGRFLFDDRVRVYGEVAWAAYQNIPGNPSPFRFDVGTEWVRRRCTGCTGQPFVATNWRFDGSTGYDLDYSLQVGWIWRDGTRRFGEARVFGQYYTGHAPYGQFYTTRESWFGVGVAFDY
ncbi:Protein containing DUF1207 OS=Rhodopirellula maiorica SM1 GN=RMSM_02997 PE=4 SV=1: DUF1207 [Gemmataceae bacterium]|nr:Protein containing DUF1207 OS=Rhodopirellula maiorica SM1 GN=RMSM_02997 PE=4 SV=1: DUF1207 [Gemmataceae bacterium]VTU01604.1 Protein containing DUF1207 OS=Rhodopirellula maiorica SM1 GN=RMSM_02997 PE=4 SV=1: DUF1207 [Gemmataceae bacterium]